MTGTSQQKEQSQTAWLRARQDGIQVKSSLEDVKEFAYKVFDQLDIDGDGFVTCAELSNNFTNPATGWREKSFLLFLIRRMDDISSAYEEEWAGDKQGMSRVDLQEYFEQIEIGEDGSCQTHPNENAWQKTPKPTGGISINQTFKDIHDFAMKTFDTLDQDGDGFLSRQELQYAVANDLTDWREKSFLIFLMRNLEKIANSFDEKWSPENDGVSRIDLQEYFRKLQ